LKAAAVIEVTLAMGGHIHERANTQYLPSSITNLFSSQELNMARPLEVDQKGCLITGCCRNPFSLTLKRFLTNLSPPPGDVKTRLEGSKS
jgi:hypothetical protein